MEDNVNMFEALYEKVVDYGKTSLELNKLKAIDKSVDVVSSIIPLAIVFVLFTFLLLSLTIGMALLIGDMLDKVAYGFFIVAGFYLVIVLIAHFFFHDRLKRFFGNMVIKMLFK